MVTACDCDIDLEGKLQGRWEKERYMRKVLFLFYANSLIPPMLQVGGFD